MKKVKSIRDGDKTFYRHDWDVGFWGKSNFQKEVSFPVCPEKIFSISHNALGNRDIDITRNHDQPNIVCIGGSHTWGYGVDQSSRYTEILRKNLFANVYNFGHCSLGLDQIAIALNEKCRDVKPDVIVIEQYPWAIHRIMAQQVNGFVRPNFYLDEHDGLELKSVPKYSHTKIYRSLFKNYALFKKKYVEFLEGINVEVGYKAEVDPIYLKWKAGFYSYMYELAEAIVQLISSFCKDNQIALIFVLGTVREKAFQKNTVRLIDYDLPRHKLSTILTRNNISFIDTCDNSLLLFEQNKRVMFDDGHMNEFGHLQFAKQIQKWLLEQGLCNEKS